MPQFQEEYYSNTSFLPKIKKLKKSGVRIKKLIYAKYLPPIFFGLVI